MEYNHTPMTKVWEKDNEIHIEMECTIKIGDFECIKPKMSTTVMSYEDVNSTLRILSGALMAQHTQLSKNKNYGG